MSEAPTNLTTNENLQSSSSILWLPYVLISALFSTFLLCSFLRYHFKKREAYQQKLRERWAKEELGVTYVMTESGAVPARRLQMSDAASSWRDLSNDRDTRNQDNGLYIISDGINLDTVNEIGRGDEDCNTMVGPSKHNVCNSTGDITRELQKCGEQDQMSKSDSCIISVEPVKKKRRKKKRSLVAYDKETMTDFDGILLGCRDDVSRFDEIRIMDLTFENR